MPSSKNDFQLPSSKISYNFLVECTGGSVCSMGICLCPPELVQEGTVCVSRTIYGVVPPVPPPVPVMPPPPPAPAFAAVSQIFWGCCTLKCAKAGKFE